MENGDRRLPDEILSTFERLWQNVLAVPVLDKKSVLEPACGSANDYRFLERFGIASHLHYTGFDLCPKNISNARAMYPQIDFRVDNLLDSSCADQPADYAFVHDLLEHFSAEAIDRGIETLCRMAKKEIWIHFFNLNWNTFHIMLPMETYHWNLLSLPAIKKQFQKYASSVQVLHIQSFLRSFFPTAETHNPGAFTLIVKLHD